MKSQLTLAVAFFAAAFGLQANTATFSGNGNTGFGGPVGPGSLGVADSGSSLSFTLNRGSGTFNDALVIYIDSVAGGFSSTSGFSDQGDNGRRSVSGIGWDGRSAITFASGFLPDYAITIDNGYASLFQLAAGGDNSLTWIMGAGQVGGNSAATYSLSIDPAQIGLTVGAGQTIGLFGTLTAASGWRSTEAVAGDYTGTQGINDFTQTSFGSYTLTAVPEPSSLALGLCALAVGGLLRRRS